MFRKLSRTARIRLIAIVAGVPFALMLVSLLLRHVIFVPAPETAATHTAPLEKEAGDDLR